jgi:hypothetical protein
MGFLMGPSVPSPTAQIGREPTGEAAPCQNALRRMRMSPSLIPVLSTARHGCGCSIARPVARSS